MADIGNFLERWFELQSAIEGVKDGTVSAEDFYSLYNTGNNYGMTLNSDQEKWLDNMLANQRTEEARKWEDYMASNDLLRAAGQLNELGLSSNNVLQTGGSSSNPVSAADTVKTNLANQKYERQNALARSLISMASAMAHAGITGGSIGLVRGVASKAASATAHSADMISRDEARQAFIRAGLEEHYKKYYG